MNGMIADLDAEVLDAAGDKISAVAAQGPYSGLRCIG